MRSVGILILFNVSKLWPQPILPLACSSFLAFIGVFYNSQYIPTCHINPYKYTQCVHLLPTCLINPYKYTQCVHLLPTCHINKIRLPFPAPSCLPCFQISEGVGEGTSPLQKASVSSGSVQFWSFWSYLSQKRMPCQRWKAQPFPPQMPITSPRLFAFAFLTGYKSWFS